MYSMIFKYLSDNTVNEKKYTDIVFCTKQYNNHMYDVN